jgi:hypothetical protein
VKVYRPVLEALAFDLPPESIPIGAGSFGLGELLGFGGLKLELVLRGV